MVAVAWYSLGGRTSGYVVRALGLLTATREIRPTIICPSPAPVGIAAETVRHSRLASFRLPFNAQVLNLLTPLPKAQVARRAAVLKPAYIQAEGLWAFPAARDAARRLGLPVVLNVYNLESVVAATADRPITSVILAQLEGRWFQQADLILCASELDRRQVARLARFPAEKIFVVPNGVDPARFPSLAQPEPKVSRPVVLLVGKGDYPPNREALREIQEVIAPRVQAKIPEVLFRVVGDHYGPQPSSPFVEMVGYLPDINAAIRAADLCIAPLRSGSGTRIRILEYLACGRPVVTTSRGCAGLELLSEEHLMVAEDPESFALAIIGLLREPARAAALGAAGRQAVLHRYTWEAIARQYEEDVRAFLRI